MHVQPAGKNRVRKEKRKNVHAYIQGVEVKTPIDNLNFNNDPKWQRITYNPYADDTFIVVDTDEPIHAAAMVVFTEEGKVFAI